MAGVCRYCGAECSDGARFCIMCGARIEEGNALEKGTEEQGKTENTDIWSRAASFENGIGADAYTAAPDIEKVGMIPPVTVHRETNIAAFVLAVINFVLGCSFVGIGFGGAVLYIANMAKNSPSDEDHRKYNKIAVIIGVVGIVLSLLVFVAAVATLKLVMGGETNI